MHIETLKTFCDLADTGSFNKAAELNFVSQSAVSQQVKALEARYGQQLFERRGRRGVVLTEAGRIFHTECKLILERFRGLEERLAAPSTAMVGTIKIATVYSVGLHGLPPYVTQFMKAHPRVNVHVEYSRTDKVRRACLDGTIDFGIVALPVRPANVEVIPWREEKLVLVCPSSHRLGRRRKVRLALLAGEPFIAFERDIPTRKTIDRILRAHHVAVKTVMEFDNIETIKRSVEVGGGLSILPEATVISEVKSGQLVALDFAEGRFVRTVGVIYRRGSVMSASAREFVQLLTKAA